MRSSYWNTNDLRTICQATDIIPITKTKPASATSITKIIRRAIAVWADANPTRKGRPRIAELTDAVGFAITADERDRAWRAHRARTRRVWSRDPEHDRGEPGMNDPHYHGWTIHHGGRSMFMVAMRFPSAQAADQFLASRGRTRGTFRVFKCKLPCPCGEREEHRGSPELVGEAAYSDPANVPAHVRAAR